MTGQNTRSSLSKRAPFASAAERRVEATASGERHKLLARVVVDGISVCVVVVLAVAFLVAIMEWRVVLDITNLTIVTIFKVRHLAWRCFHRERNRVKLQRLGQLSVQCVISSIRCSASTLNSREDS